MEKLIKFDIESIEKLMNEDKKENKGKVESMKDPALFYINQEIKLGDISKYEVTAKIGRGRYSEVFSGEEKYTNEKIVLKILKPISKNKIKREVVILKYLNECPNSVHLLDITKGEQTEIYCLIYNNISGHELKLVNKNISPNDMKLYIYKILQCLSFCHTRAGTRFYKAPELLLDFKKYDYSIDIWSTGCVLASLLFQVDFFFKGSDLNDQLVKIVEVLGYEEFEKFWEKNKNNDIKINNKTLTRIKNLKKKEWKNFVNENNKYLINDDVLDLLNKMLTFDPSERIKAKDALNHPYFNDLKKLSINNNEDKKE